jgi:hypothetical protein
MRQAKTFLSGILTFLITFSTFAQEHDDLYFNRADRKKLRENKETVAAVSSFGKQSTYINDKGQVVTENASDEFDPSLIDRYRTGRSIEDYQNPNYSVPEANDLNTNYSTATNRNWSNSNNGNFNTNWSAGWGWNSLGMTSFMLGYGMNSFFGPSMGWNTWNNPYMGWGGYNPYWNSFAYNPMWGAFNPWCPSPFYGNSFIIIGGEQGRSHVRGARITRENNSQRLNQTITDSRNRLAIGNSSSSSVSNSNAGTGSERINTRLSDRIVNSINRNSYKNQRNYNFNRFSRSGAKSSNSYNGSFTRYNQSSRGRNYNYKSTSGYKSNSSFNTRSYGRSSSVGRSSSRSSSGRSGRGR